MSETARNTYIDGYIVRAKIAQAEFEKLSQAKVDAAVKIIGKTIYENAEKLAQLAVEETGMGNLPDKIAKNKSKAMIIWNSLKDKKSRGIIERDPVTGITKVAKPIGVVAAITPCTNPIVTPMSNAMFALKCGNAIVITPHHKAIKCSTLAVELINEQLKKNGFPKHLIQILDQHSRDNTRALISSADIVVATGGMGMVKAAYSSGKPALGVGAGNVQCIIDKGYDPVIAVEKIVKGRGFDYGIICSGEQSVICHEDDYSRVLQEFKRNKAAVIQAPEDVEKIRKAVFPGGKMNGELVGQSAKAVADAAEIMIPEDTTVIVVEANGPGVKDLLAKEKMCPVLATFKYQDFSEAIEIARLNLEAEGKGHSVSLHSEKIEHIEQAGETLSVSRFVVNQVSATGAGGSFYNGLAPTNTLGCGSWGNNSISENLDYKHLMNVSRIAYYMENNVVPDEATFWD